MATANLAFEKGLPANLDAERFVLGSILLNQDAYFQVAAAIEPGDFSLEKHRRIFARMKDLYDRGEKIDRVTLDRVVQPDRDAGLCWQLHRQLRGRCR